MTELTYTVQGTELRCDLVLLGSADVAAGKVKYSLSYGAWRNEISYIDGEVIFDGATHVSSSSGQTFSNTPQVERVRGRKVVLPVGTYFVDSSTYIPEESGVIPNDPDVPREYWGKTYSGHSEPLAWSVALDPQVAETKTVKATSAQVASARSTRASAYAAADGAYTKTVKAAKKRLAMEKTKAKAEKSKALRTKATKAATTRYTKSIKAAKSRKNTVRARAQKRFQSAVAPASKVTWKSRPTIAGEGSVSPANRPLT